MCGRRKLVCVCHNYYHYHYIIIDLFTVFHDVERYATRRCLDFRQANLEADDWVTNGVGRRGSLYAIINLFLSKTLLITYRTWHNSTSIIIYLNFFIVILIIESRQIHSCLNFIVQRFKCKNFVFRCFAE